MNLGPLECIEELTEVVKKLTEIVKEHEIRIKMLESRNTLYGTMQNKTDEEE